MSGGRKLKNPHIGGTQQPLFTPSSEWQPPNTLPDLIKHSIIALDTETRDDGLQAGKGSGWVTKAGHVAGISVAWEDSSQAGGFASCYVPLKHTDSENFDPPFVRQWLTDLLKSETRIVTQSGLYDWGWLRSEFDLKMPDSSRLDDTGAAATMVDENRFTYNLDDLCAWQGVPGKDNNLLLDALATYGYPSTKDTYKQNLWHLPARYVGPYAEADAVATLALFGKLQRKIVEEDTQEAYRLEIDLLPMVHEMRYRGIRVDTDAAEKGMHYLYNKRDQIFAQLKDRLGLSVGMTEIGSPKWMERVFDSQKISYPRTEKTKQGSFTGGKGGWMASHPHWLPKLIAQADKYHNAASKFLQGFILDYAHKGRLHSEIHPHRSDEGGTRSYRFSYSDPPLQQMTARDKEITPLIRECFLPEEGEQWCKPDYSQQEYRLIVHFASLLKLKKIDEAVQLYKDNPKTDFHKLVVDWTGLERDNAKDTNFAKAFGAGIPKFAAMINKSEDEAREIYTKYDNELPFVNQLSTRCQSAAEKRGYVRLLDGARSHFDTWEAAYLTYEERQRGYREQYRMNNCSLEEAHKRQEQDGHPWRGKRLKRGDCRKAMNRLIQGSAARQTKLAMRAAWREGIVPLLQMHDEIDVSCSCAQDGMKMAEIMREAVTLEVPVAVDVKFGKSWGDAKHDWGDT